MLNKQVVENFLSRKLENFDWMKTQSRDELLDAINQLTPKPDLGKLWDHQLVCFLILESLKRFMLHIDMGGGKTRISLSLLRYRKQRGERPKAIVFVPYITAIDSWVGEIRDNFPDLTCVPLHGTTEENFHALFTQKAEVFVMCYQSAVAMLWEPIKGKRKGKSKKKWTLDPEFVREVFAKFDTLIMDEIHACKDIGSLYYKMCRAISAQCEYAIGLTGTPFGKDMQDLWPQFYLIDFGETLGDTMGIFRAAFFNESRNYWGGFEFKFKKKLFTKLQEVIKHSSIRYAIDELRDMPQKKYVKKLLQRPEAWDVYYKKTFNELKEAIKAPGKVSHTLVNSKYLMLRQISSGFMTLKGEDSSKVQIRFDENPKLEALEELVAAMPHDSKMVVFHHFVFTNAMISEKLTAMKVGHARVWSGQRDPLGEIDRFKRDPNCRVLVINAKSGSSSLNLQVANYCVFFEQPEGAIDREQAERRVWRPGQTKRVFYYDLFVKGTSDYPKFASNKQGEDLLKRLLDGGVSIDDLME